MYLLFKSLLLFITKTVIIEWTVELLRALHYLIQHSTLPSKFFMEHPNPYLNATINSLETLCVMALLYLGFNVYGIVGFTFCFTYIVQKIGERLLRP